MEFIKLLIVLVFLSFTLRHVRSRVNHRLIYAADRRRLWILGCGVDVVNDRKTRTINI